MTSVDDREEIPPPPTGAGPRKAPPPLAPSRSIPPWAASALARAGEASWRLLHLPGRPPLTRFAYWVSAQECTIRINKAREQLGYEPVTSIADGLAELRAA